MTNLAVLLRMEASTLRPRFRERFSDRGWLGVNKGASMAWVFLGIAGLFEVVWAYFMKQSDGFTKPTPTILTMISMLVSFGMLSVSMKSLPLGTAYTVWTGIGALGAFAVGVALLGEPLSFVRGAAFLLILSGLFLMKLSSS